MNIIKAINAYCDFIKNAEILDKSDLFAKKQLENKEKQEAEEIKKEFDAANKLLQSTKEEYPSNIRDIKQRDPEALENKVFEKYHVWQYRFSDVQKDDAGFFLIKDATTANMKIGDQITDASLNLTPYWEISSITGNRINLKPIGSNPFLTGIGADGRKLTKFDVDVFSGKIEKERLEKINEIMESGEATIDDVKYALLGTVPVQMGPAGHQGGGYHVNDSVNRGGQKGMSPKEIMIADAKTLNNLGLTVPLAALDKTMDPDDWQTWIQTEMPDKIEYFPKDIDRYIDFHKKMTEKGRYHYDEEGIDEMREKLSPNYIEKLEEKWGNIVGDFTQLSTNEFKIKHPELFFSWDKDHKYTLMELTNWGIHEINDAKKKRQALKAYLTANEIENDESVLRNIYSKEPRVSTRNILILIEMAKEDPTYIKYLHDFIKLGGRHWFGNEKIINFFSLVDDVEGLKLCMKYLVDPTNLKYAGAALINHNELDYAVDTIKNSQNFEAIYGVMKELIPAIKNKNLDKSIVENAILEINIPEKLKNLLDEPDPSPAQTYYAGDLCVAINNFLYYHNPDMAKIFKNFYHQLNKETK